MESEISDDRRSARSPNTWLQLALLAGFLFCLVLGLGSLSALLLVRQEPEVPTGSVLRQITPDHIVPQLALAQLAGDPADGLMHQALSAGELDTALVILLFDTTITGTQRLLYYQQLARRYELLDGQKNAQILPLLYNLILTQAVLDSNLTITERQQALVHVAQGYWSLEDAQSALDAASQAKRMAAQAPALLPAQRSQVFERLRPLARQLEDDLFNQQIDELIRSPYLEPAGTIVTPRWPSLSQPVPIDPDVDSTITLRQQTARQLADRITATGGNDIEPERQALAAVLIAEDQVRADAFRRTLSAGLTLEQQFTLVNARRYWLAQKVRIGLGGYGLSIVPEWEANIEFLLEDLATTTTNLNAILDALGNALPTPTDKAMFRVEVIRWLALQSQLGLYPNASDVELGQRLEVAQSELTAQGQPLAMPVAYQSDAAPPGFRIVEQ